MNNTNNTIRKDISNIRANHSFSKKNSFIYYLRKNMSLYLMIIPGLLILLIFKYLPMYGILVSFMDYMPAKGVLASNWVGLKHFIRFINDPYFTRILKNTLSIGILTLIFSFPAPILFALLLNELKSTLFKRITQTISYMPYFLSVVIVVGLIKDFTGLSEGVVNDIVQSLGGQRINYLDKAEWFYPLFIFSSVWQGVGFGSIIYLAAISGIDPELYESTKIEGANRFQQIIYVTIPSITPTIVIMFILAVGVVLVNDFQKILLMYNPATYQTGDVIQTYVYRAGIEGASFSYASAVGVFLAVISFVFLYVTNKISKAVGDTYLW